MIGKERRRENIGGEEETREEGDERREQLRRLGNKGGKEEMRGQGRKTELRNTGRSR